MRYEVKGINIRILPESKKHQETFSQLQRQSQLFITSKMLIPRAIQAAVLLAIFVPVQAWNRLDKDNAVSILIPLIII